MQSFQVFISVLFRISNELCINDHRLILEYFYLPKKKNQHNPVLTSSHSLYLSQRQETTNQISVSIDLPILDISYNWNYTICGLL